MSFYRQAGRPLSRRALLTGYLLAWLKRCVISSLPNDDITPLVIFLVVQLVCGRLLGLGLLYSKWAPDIDGAILYKDNQQEGGERDGFHT